MSFDKIFDLTGGVYLNFYKNIKIKDLVDTDVRNIVCDPLIARTDHICIIGLWYTRSAGSRRSCGVWGRRGRWRGGGGMIKNYVMDG